MMELTLYRPVKVTGQSYKDAKKHVVPNQAMSLQEIIQRFTRRESLPVEREGIFRTDMGDLEKQQTEDFTYHHERAQEIREKIKSAKKRMEDQHKARIDAELQKQIDAQKATTLQTLNSGTQAP